jgi:hypothetical protein
MSFSAAAKADGRIYSCLNSMWKSFHSVFGGSNAKKVTSDGWKVVGSVSYQEVASLSSRHIVRDVDGGFGNPDL